MYERALQGMEKVLDPTRVAGHIPALTTIENFGDLFKSQGKLSDAKRMYSKVHSGFITLLGPSNHDCQRLEHNLQSLEAELGKDSSLLFLS